MVWFHALAESQHELQNATSAEKIRLVGAAAGLGPDSRILDVASGRGGPALVLAQSSAHASSASRSGPASRRRHASAPRRPGSRT